MVLNARITKLQALNYVLAQAGELPVNTLTTLPRNASRALEVLEETILMTQADTSFWRLNTEKCKMLHPDVLNDNRIQVAANVTAISNSRGSPRYILRGDYVYDVEFNTYSFDSPITVDVMLILEWESLSTSMRWYIQRVTARLYQVRWVANAELHNYNQQEELTARAAVLSNELTEAPVSLLDNPTISKYTNRYV